MMKKVSGLATGTLLACLFVTLVNGQITVLPDWEIGVSGGVMFYQGDLTPSAAGSFKLLSGAGMVFASRPVSRAISLKTSVIVGKLRGDDRKSGEESRERRALKFQTVVFEGTESVVYDLFSNNDGRLRFSPYVFAGIGFSFLSVQRDASRFDSVFFSGYQSVIDGLHADMRHTPPHWVLVVPVGIGIRYVVTQNVLLNLEGGYRFSETDYLDGFSRVGNNGRNDHYYTITAGVSINFYHSREIRCPRRPNRYY